MYRAWQRRHAERASSRGRPRVTNGEAVSPVPAVTIPNATDVFYSRLNAALEVRSVALPDEAVLRAQCSLPVIRGSTDALEA